MKKLLVFISLAILSFSAFAQEERIPQRMELAQVEINDGAVRLEVFQLIGSKSSDGYYLSLGHVGFGDSFIQIQLIPLTELVIPLGGTLTEALEALEELKDFCNTEPGTTMKTVGCLAFGFPGENVEPLTVTSRKAIFRRMVEFSLERDGYQRVTLISRSDLKSIIASAKFYAKIHPNEK